MRTMPEKFILAHNGSEWAGTFQVVLDAVIRDMTSGGDGPFRAVLTFVDDSSSGCWDAEVVITMIDERFIYTADAGSFLRGDIYAIEI